MKNTVHASFINYIQSSTVVRNLGKQPKNGWCVIMAELTDPSYLVYHGFQ